MHALHERPLTYTPLALWKTPCGKEFPTGFFLLKWSWRLHFMKTVGWPSCRAFAAAYRWPPEILWGCDPLNAFRWWIWWTCLLPRPGVLPIDWIFNEMYLFTAKAQRTQRFNYFQKKCSFILCRPSCPPVFLEDQRQRIRKNISAFFASLRWKQFDIMDVLTYLTAQAKIF